MNKTQIVVFYCLKNWVKKVNKIKTITQPARYLLCISFIKKTYQQKRMQKLILTNQSV